MINGSIWYYVFEDMKEPLGYLLWAGMLGVLAAALLWICDKVRRRDPGRSRLPWILFLMYLFVAAQVGFFSREPGSRQSLDLQLFATWGHSSQGDAYVIENIIMFLPWGFLLPLIWRPLRTRGWLCVLLAAAASTFLEAMQYLTMRGYSQLDDVVMNTVGALAGWLLLRLWLFYRER